MRRILALSIHKVFQKAIEENDLQYLTDRYSQWPFLKFKSSFVQTNTSSFYRLIRCHNFQIEKHVCEILSRHFHSSSFSRVVSARNEELFSNITIFQLCCRGRRKTDTYNRSGAFFIQEPRKFSPIDSNSVKTKILN